MAKEFNKQSADMDNALLTEQSRKVGEVVKSAKKKIPKKIFDEEIPSSSYMKRVQMKRKRNKEVLNSLGLGPGKGKITRPRRTTSTSNKKTSGGTPKKKPTSKKIPTPKKILTPKKKHTSKKTPNLKNVPKKKSPPCKKKLIL